MWNSPLPHSLSSTGLVLEPSSESATPASKLASQLVSALVPAGAAGAAGGGGGGGGGGTACTAAAGNDEAEVALLAERARASGQLREQVERALGLYDAEIEVWNTDSNRQ